jgi:hypothetical protein
MYLALISGRFLNKPELSFKKNLPVFFKKEVDIDTVTNYNWW